MILLTRLNRIDQFYINEDKIEFIEETPDTVISLESGKKIVVMEPAELVIRRIFEVRHKQATYKRETEPGIPIEE